MADLSRTPESAQAAGRRRYWLASACGFAAMLVAFSGLGVWAIPLVIASYYLSVSGAGHYGWSRGYLARVELDSLAGGRRG